MVAQSSCKRLTATDVGVKPWVRNRNSLGGILGLGLLVLAFAYRWWWTPGEDAATDEDAALAQAYEAAAQQIAAAPEPTTTPTEDDKPESATPTSTLADDARAEFTEAIARAEKAAAAGHLVFPAEDNAVTWYDRALEIDGKNRVARRARAKALADAVESAQVAIDQGDLKTAALWTAALAEIDDAKAELDKIQRRLDTLPKLEEALREGAQRIAAGQYYEPSGASALDSYRAALALDARSVVARQGLSEIEASVLTRALAAATEDQFADADRLLAFAGEIVPGSQAQLQTRTRIVALRDERARGLIQRIGAALDARDLDRATEYLVRAEAFGVSAEQLQSLRERLANARLYDHYNPGETFTDSFVDRGGAGPEMVVIPIGEFRMGSPDKERGREASEGPQHTVEMSRPFALARNEITVADFGRFVRDTEYQTDAERLGSTGFYDEKSGRIASARDINWRHDYAGETADDRAPVVHVSWNDARAFAQWLSQRTGKRYRLPTEAEFEYVLRAGTTTRYWWGAGNLTTVRGNFTGSEDRSRSRRSWTRAFPRYGDGYWGPAPVRTYAANPLGVFDIDGNVSEWTEDCWHDSYLRAPEDGSDWVNKGCDRRVVRGGSWGSAPDQVRSAFRQGSPASARGARIGLRVVREL